ncbi:MAG TPA: hypothetical protein VJ991_01255 [Balneolales bacterium]|nr:hypothetical protein [Balneolales bacterium]
MNIKNGRRVNGKNRNMAGTHDLAIILGIPQFVSDKIILKLLFELFGLK